MSSGFRKSFKITKWKPNKWWGADDYILFSKLELEAQDIANSGWNYTIHLISFMTIIFLGKIKCCTNFLWNILYGRWYTANLCMGNRFFNC